MRSPGLKGDAIMLNDKDPTASDEEWIMASRSRGADYQINKASIDELLTKLHSMASEGLEVNVEFIKTILSGRYTEASVNAMDRLTKALNEASKSSTRIEYGLFAVGLATVILAFLNYFK
jgi:hypothetical protein